MNKYSSIFRNYLNIETGDILEQIDINDDNKQSYIELTEYNYADFLTEKECIEFEQDLNVLEDIRFIRELFFLYKGTDKEFIFSERIWRIYKK